MKESSLSEVKGTIFNIQRYSLDDGPGIRTLVFLKGCLLQCLWCANPESQHTEIELMDGNTVGKVVTAGDVLDVVSRDKVFYQRSGGGMTLSGGDPVIQPEFSAALVAEAKKRDIHVTVETAGYQQWELLWKVIENVDLILLDIKIMDSKLHEKYTGVSNDLILDNARKITNMNKQVIARIPIIPGYNDDRNNLTETAMFCKNNGMKAIHLLPYHRLGASKYEKLGREYELEDVLPPLRKGLQLIASKLEDKFEIPVVVI